MIKIKTKKNEEEKQIKIKEKKNGLQLLSKKIRRRTDEKKTN